MAEIKVEITVSDPWDFTSNDAIHIFRGTVAQTDDADTQALVLLDRVIEYRGKKFNKVLCLVRYVNQVFIWKKDEKDSQSCAIVGVPDDVFDREKPFFYDFHSMINLLGSFAVI